MFFILVRFECNPSRWSPVVILRSLQVIRRDIWGQEVAAMMYCGATVIEEAESTCKVGGDVGSAVGRTVGGAVGISASGVAREGRILRHHPRIHMY